MKIFITRAIPGPGFDILKKNHEVAVNPYDRILSKREIINGIKGKDGLLCLLTDTIDKDVITSSSKLKMIANYAVGYDNIDIQVATNRGIPVSNTPDVLTEATAEMGWALLISVARRIVEGDTFVRAGKFTGWSPSLLLGQDIAHKTLGIIGAGRIGTAFAKKSKGFAMKVLYVDERPNPVLEQELQATRVDLNTLLKKADFISFHIPLTSSTHHLISEKELRKMKPTTILINTSRGAVIDEKALARALQNHWIFGAGLDVYENEPEIFSDLVHLDNVILQPHTASATVEARANMAIMAAENMIAGLRGDIPPNCVNKEVFDS